MKAFQTILALLVIAVFAAQPALAGSSCVMSAASQSCGPGCGMAMAQMVVDCPMAKATISLDYCQDCCRQTMTQTTARLEIPASPKAIRTEFVAAASQNVTDVKPTQEIAETLLASASPPRYLLFQVFRI